MIMEGQTLKEELVRPFLSSEQEGRLLKKLIDMEQDICPDRKLLLRPYEIPCSQVVLVIMASNPYSDGDGLALSSFKSWKDGEMNVFTKAILTAIRKQLYDYMGDTVFKGAFPHGLLVNWKDRGALLINAVASRTTSNPEAHYERGWEIINQRVIERVSSENRSIAFLTIGDKAKQLMDGCSKYDRHLYRHLPYNPAKVEADTSTFLEIHEFLKDQYERNPFWKYERKDYNSFASIDTEGMIGKVKKDILEAQIPMPNAKQRVTKLSEEAIAFMNDLDMNLRANFDYVFDFRTKL